MNQYLVTAYDYTDEDAFDRRMNIRPRHLDGAVALKADGNYIAGGAILDDQGKMIGSMMVLQFETEQELQAWQRHEPYITEGIWETFEIKPFRLANV